MPKQTGAMVISSWILASVISGLDLANPDYCSGPEFISTDE
jgi:hypothetical protein